MDKQAAFARLTAIEDEAKALRNIIFAPDSLINPDEPTRSYTFTVPQSTAEAYVTAITTLLRLRQQPGTVVPHASCGGTSGNTQFFIEPRFSTSDEEWEIGVTRYSGVATKLARISPPFETAKAAEAAIKTLTQGSLLAMFFNLHHFTPGR